MQANRIAPGGTPRIAASHLGLLCLPMSHKNDARLIWVKLQLSTLKLYFQYLRLTLASNTKRLGINCGSFYFCIFAAGISPMKQISNLTRLDD